MGKKREFRGAEFGKTFAKARELDEETEDSDINFARTFLPTYPQREVTMEVHNGICVVLGKYDGFDPDIPLIADDKTTKKLIQNGKPGFKWTQVKVDKCKQLTWYAYIYWKKTGVIPKLQLNWYDWNSKKAVTFNTVRGINDFLMLHHEIKIVHAGIVSLCAETYNNI